MGLRIRRAETSNAGPIARVHVDTWRTTYSGIVPDEYLVSLSYRDRESVWTEILTTGSPRTSNFVAETDGGEVVGFADGGPEREGTGPTGVNSTRSTFSKGISGEVWVVALFQPWPSA